MNSETPEETKTKEEILSLACNETVQYLSLANEATIIRPSEALEAMQLFADQEVAKARKEDAEKLLKYVQSLRKDSESYDYDHGFNNAIWNIEEFITNKLTELKKE